MYKNGEFFGNRDFTLRYLKNGNDTNRLGIVVSKKVSKKAVVRNKIRRQIKAYMTENATTLKQGYDMIITAKPICAEESYQVLAKSLGHLFYKKNLLKKN